jgi:hypothetical protein
MGEGDPIRRHQTGVTCRGSIASDERQRWHVRTTPDSGCIVVVQRTGAPGQLQTYALQNRPQEVGPTARCNPFPCILGRDRLPLKRLEV